MRFILSFLLPCLVTIHANAISFHSDPTTNANAIIAMKYLGKLSTEELKSLNSLPTENPITALILELDPLVRRQIADVPLRFPAHPFRDEIERANALEKNPNADLFPRFELKDLHPELKKFLESAEANLVFDNTHMKGSLTPVELSRLLSSIEGDTLPLSKTALQELRDAVAEHLIQSYNYLVGKTGACHGGPQKKLSVPSHEDQ